MTKPVIVTRLGKGSELTFQEGDDNFTNLRDATINVSGDSGTTQNIELNGSLTVSGGTGLSTAMTTGTVTVNLDNTAVTPSSYTNANITVDAQGRITSAANGFSGSYTDLTNKPTIPTAVSQLTNDSGFITGINSSAVTTALGFTPENAANKNTANGYAGLDSNGKVASAQLPSYVDDVEEYTNLANLPATGETGKIYVAQDTGKIYRWSGSAYIEISPSPGTTDSLTEGSTNLYFTTQRARDSFSASTGITITNGAIATTITQGITDVVQDTTPQLGGNLDVNGQAISSVSNGNIRIEPNGTGNIVLTPATGKIILGALDFPTGTGTNGQVLTTNGTGAMSWSTPSSGGIANVVEDTTPELGGNLDLKGFTITSTGSAGSGEQINIVPGYRLEPINLKSANIALNQTGNTSQTSIYTVAEQNLKLYANDNGGTGGIVIIPAAANGNITVTPNGTGLTKVKNLQYYENVYSLGTTSGTITPDVANGNVQTITLNGNLTFSAFSNPVAGQSMTLIINTNGTGRTLTSTMKFSGGSKTLSTTSTIDIISVFYDGTNYWASLSKDFK